MRTLTITLSLALANMFCFAQTYSDLISDKEIIAFLAWEVNSTKGHSAKRFLSSKRKVSRSILEWDSLNFIKPDSLSEDDISVRFSYLFQKKNQIDTIFTAEDRQYFLEQFQSYKSSIWKFKLPKATLTSRKNKIYFYSLPMFSKDRKYVIIRREYYCGSLCAYGGYFIYKKLNENQWQHVKTVNYWIS
jgi:hypothetical protein